jgi:hypothetical protein
VMISYFRFWSNFGRFLNKIHLHDTKLTTLVLSDKHSKIHFLHVWTMALKSRRVLYVNPGNILYSEQFHLRISKEIMLYLLLKLDIKIVRDQNQWWDTTTNHSNFVFGFFNCNCIIGILPIPKFTLAKNKLGNNTADNFFKHLIGKTVRRPSLN